MMKLRYPIFFIIFFCSFFVIVFAENFFITSLLPNTDDDANLEYVEIINSSQTQVNINWYVLKDKSDKSYTFPEIILQPWESKKLSRIESKIILNNTDEELWLYDGSGNLIDNYTYSTSIKNVPIITGHLPSIIISPPEPLPSNTEVSDSWATSTWATSSWEISMPTEGNSWAVLTDSGAISGTWTDPGVQLEAMRLYYSDTDSNGRVDQLEIEFNETITGFLVNANLKLYSNSGWLSLSKIDLSSEVSSGSHMSGSILYIDLIEQDNLKAELHVNNSTSSDLRLKSYSWIGIFDLSWNEMKPITLTSSFSDYKNVFKRGWSDYPITETGATSVLIWPIPDSWSTWSLLPLFIPDISISLQQPSYVIRSELDESLYLCDDIHDDCKANFTIENSFSGIAYQSKLGCTMSVGTWETIDSCNPSTTDFWSWLTQIEFRIFEKADPLNFKSQIITISNLPKIRIVPTPVITVQSWLNSENTCNKVECSVNFTWDKSFISPESKYSCLWDFWWWVFADWSQNSCNPSYIKYRPWIYIVSLKIYEKWNEPNYKEAYLRVRNDYFFGAPLNSSEETANTWSIFKIKIEWAIDNEFKKLEWNSLYCSSYDFCPVNFSVVNTASWTLKGKFSYLWDFGNSTTSDKKNPPTVKYSSGTYTIRLKVSDIIWNSQTDVFHVFYVPKIKEIKPKKEKSKENLEKDEYKEFTALFKEMMSVVQEEMEVEKLLDKLLERTQKEIDFLSNFKLKLQWKKSKNLYFAKNDSISCRTRKSCSINLWLEVPKIEWFKYLWDFGNGLTMTWSNPKTLKYVPWRYSASLSVFDENDKPIMKKDFKIQVSKIPPAKKKTNAKKKKKKPSVKQNKIEIKEKYNKKIPTSYLGIMSGKGLISSVFVILSLALLFVYLTRRKIT
ncbi:MAG: hypothetical protein ACD_2C00256G0010 [uncultured bacterium (gcode 4)]|uniref:PKD domain-containing protein n=1 Tax=uncultured bacterium (gcode 4) TaxID=1234023 RepID=K2G181_9BACT|nr:MAG: hypothetical protein ACD_2C00256G0010 [uncultured bacterium (gcode 4)]